MPIELNHTIVRSRDKARAAQFLATILGVPLSPQWGPFQPIELGNGVTLEYLDVDDTTVQSQHYAFLVDDATFDAAFARIEATRVAYWADPFFRQPGRINQLYGGRGVYFLDPDGHVMELMTAVYGAVPA